MLDRIFSRQTTTQRSNPQRARAKNAAQTGAILPCGCGFPKQTVVAQGHQNKQYASWPGLTWEAVNKHFPESEETLNGHGQKTRSGLRSTKTSTQNDDDEEIGKTLHLPRPATKQKETITQIYDLSDKAKCQMYTDQTGRFPKKSSRGAPVHHGADQN